ncbi:MAG: nitrogenase [Clostridia bacterium]|nr:nitrogenase [Clostridia bacterium]MBQ8512708.1 nitrogenase [Clostridia bacterium]
MLKKLNESPRTDTKIPIRDAKFPAPFASGLEYAAPARGTWNIVHVGMLIPEAHEIFVCAAGCLRGVVLTAAEMGASERFSTVEVKEENLLNGDMEDLIIDGVTDVLHKLPKMPPAVLVYTSCVHHFSGCDLDLCYRVLRERFPDVDFTDCYMNPIMRKSGLTPDQLMRKQLYSLLKPREKNPKAAAILGNDFAMNENSELVKLIRGAGYTLYEIQNCKTYEEYQKIAEASVYITTYPSAKAGGDALAERLGGTHIHLPYSLDFDEIDENLAKLAQVLGVNAPDTAGLRESCTAALKAARETITENITIDYTVCPRPMGMARLLAEHGFAVTRVYADSFTGFDKPDFNIMKEKFPDLLLSPTVHASMRFHKSEENVLAVGQKAAYFSGTEHFVNIVEGGGHWGYEAVLALCDDMTNAHNHTKPMRELIAVKGMGCSCV